MIELFTGNFTADRLAGYFKAGPRFRHRRISLRLSLRSEGVSPPSLFTMNNPG